MTDITHRFNKISVVAALVFALMIPTAGTSRAFIAPTLKIGTKCLDDILEVAAKVSGKTLTPAGRKLALTQLRNVVARHGDEAILVARKGGLELIEIAGKYGDDVWQFASRVPAGARALAMRPRELLPLTRRIGTEVLELVRLASMAESILVTEDDTIRAEFRDLLERIAAVSQGFDEIAVNTIVSGAGLAISALLVKTTVKQAKNVLWHIARRLGQTTALALGSAAADGPFPIGDVIGLVIEVGGAAYLLYVLEKDIFDKPEIAAVYPYRTAVLISRKNARCK